MEYNSVLMERCLLFMAIHKVPSLRCLINLLEKSYQQEHILMEGIITIII
jgi:hypothetical protein